MENTIQILGINDEQTVCDACGKHNLKRTVVLNMDGEIVRLGTSCAALALMGNKKQSSQKAVLEKAVFFGIVLEHLERVGLDGVKKAVWEDRRLRDSIDVEIRDGGRWRISSNFGIVAENW